MSGHVAIKIIGAAIREHREQKGMTLEGLASRADISYQYLSGIETGKENFSIRILEQLTRALDTSVLTLVVQAYERHAKGVRG